MAAELFVRVRGQVRGPFDEEKLHALVRRGQLNRFHEVSEDGTHWVRAEEYPELFLTALPVVDAQEQPGELEDVGQGPLTPAPIWPAGEPSAIRESGWYYLSAGRRCGPVEADQIRSLADAGILGPEDVVWTEGMPQWTPIRSVPGLAPTPGIVIDTFTQTRTSRPARPGISPLAIASLVLAVLWLGGVGSLLAAIFGSIALQKISDGSGQVTGKWLALSGLVLGTCSLIATVAVGIVLLLNGQ